MSFSSRNPTLSIIPGLLLILFAIAPALIAADDPDVVFAGGNRAFEDGRYGDAEEIYRRLADEGFVSEELFLNLGNTVFRQDRPGEAALWYRRVLELNPRSAEARQNLRVVKHLTGYREFELRGVDAWLARLSPGELAAVLSGGAWLGLLAFTVAFVIPRLRDWRPLLFVFAGLGLVVAAVSFWGLRRQQTRLDTDDLAIVSGNDTAALAQPLPDAVKVVELPPGSELQIVQRRGPWTYVGIPGDLRGWVRSDAIGAVRWYGPHAAPPLEAGLAEQTR